MEGHFGITVDYFTLATETKKKITKIRNSRIFQGEDNFTHQDVITLAVNALYDLEVMRNKQLKNIDSGGATGASLETINNKRPDLSNRLKDAKNGHDRPENS